jgi:hypothetical protein
MRSPFSVTRQTSITVKMRISFWKVVRAFSMASFA